MIEMDLAPPKSKFCPLSLGKMLNIMHLQVELCVQDSKERANFD